MSGPLQGVRVVELAGIGPVPFACMLLADLGADVIRVDSVQPGELAGQGHPGDFVSRGRRSIVLDLKSAAGVDVLLRLVETADMLVEGFRPGVMERLGAGPEPCLERNPRLIYGRMTGWGQHGPLSAEAGHDINYIALTGALDAIGRSDSGPVPPLNLLGDLAGGSMYLIMGLLAALHEREHSGRGQVIDAAITDGVISLMTFIHAMQATGLWEGEGRQSHLLDGGAPFYDTYQCADGKWLSVGPIEPRFHDRMMAVLGLPHDISSFAGQMDQTQWPRRREELQKAFRTRTRDEWVERFRGTDACVAPVLTSEEAMSDPHNTARQSCIERNGLRQCAPAPRFSRTNARAGDPPRRPGAHSREILAELGFDEPDVAQLFESGAARA